ncbi:MAG: RnfABCDGE type electron transport complex subunit D [Sedimentisphaerales bacterium]|nr:RnfABCDGE type electron transport complex subunit D [Sedimentisphaerales bacterium]
MAEGKKPVKLIQKQPIMRRVMFALGPCVAGGVYFFGWRSLAMVMVSCGVGFLAEWLFCRSRKEPVSEAVFVTAMIYALILPPTVPWHVLVIGILFAVVVTKMVFGGWAKNIFNPAIAGRAFVYVCFPIALTAQWAPAANPFNGHPWGALDRWTTGADPNVITGATPMAEMKLKGQTPSLQSLLVGNIAGTMGVTSAVLICIGGIYLFITRTASRVISLSVIITYVAWNTIVWLAGVEGFANPPWFGLLGGGFLFGAFFMATDPISSPRTREAQVFYGMIIATGTFVIRNFSIFNGGLMFSILLGNMFAPLLDILVRSYKSRRQHKTKEAAA